MAARRVLLQRTAGAVFALTKARVRRQEWRAPCLRQQKRPSRPHRCRRGASSSAAPASCTSSTASPTTCAPGAADSCSSPASRASARRAWWRKPPHAPRPPVRGSSGVSAGKRAAPRRTGRGVRCCAASKRMPTPPRGARGSPSWATRWRRWPPIPARRRNRGRRRGGALRHLRRRHPRPATRRGAQPLLIVLEDLHAADLPSLLFSSSPRASSRRAAGRRRHLPAGRRGTASGGRAGARPRGAGGAARAAGGLAPADIAALLGAGHADAAPTDLVAAVHAATAGNPLFVVETARGLRAGTRAARRALPPGSASPAACATRSARASHGSRPAVGRASSWPRCSAIRPTPPASRSRATNPSRRCSTRCARASLPACSPTAMPAASRSGTRSCATSSTGSAGGAPRALHLAVGRGLARRHAADLDPHLAALAHHFRAGADAAATAGKPSPSPSRPRGAPPP